MNAERENDLSHFTGEAPSEEDCVESLEDAGQEVVREELKILTKIQARIVADAEVESQELEDLDAQMIELRDAIGEAKEEDVPSLVEQMHQVAALSRTRGQGRSLPVDPQNPYFGHLRLKESRSGKARDVLVGKRTLLDDGAGLSIVDWRNAPVSRLYYRYEEEDEYEEEFDERSLEGVVLLRRSISIAEGHLRRVDSPQGTFVSNRRRKWKEATGSAKPELSGGSGKAVRVARGKLGIHDDDDTPRADKHLQEITALIDAEQFSLITQPESGVVLIQGGAGSGKTTVALHRVAYLAYQDPRRFAPSKMLIVVFNEALVEYIRHVLPSLGVAGVTVTTYRRWSAGLLRRLKLDVPAKRCDLTPEPVSRFKKHRVVLHMIDELLQEKLEGIEKGLKARLEGRQGVDAVISQWRELSKLPLSVRLERLGRWLKGDGGKLPPRTRSAAEAVLRAAKDDVEDILGDWLELFGDAERVQRSIAEHAARDFSENDIKTILRWCTDRAARIADHLEGEEPDFSDDEDEEEEKEARPPAELDGEDDAIILRLIQATRGGLFVGSRRHEYEHVVIDEAQDLCPLEVRVLLDCTSQGRSVTIAGDRAQKMIFDNGFEDWPQLLDDAGLPHVAIQPLKITYRSTRQVMELAHHVLGPLFNPEDQLVARDGAPVSYYGFGEMGESVAFLADALRGLIAREPSASVALITRFPQQAQAYYEALRLAEVPRVRWVGHQNFSFSAGIDVTDVRQVKGLEFDYVVVLDPTTQNYPERESSRHLLHIACTRTAYQLWVVCSGRPSPLIPPNLVDAGEMMD